MIGLSHLEYMIHTLLSEQCSERTGLDQGNAQ